MSVTKIEQLLETLATETDLMAALEKTGLSIHEAQEALRGSDGRACRKAFLWLSRMHVELIAHRAAGRAIGRLRDVIADGEKGDLQVKAAVCVLTAAGLDHTKTSREKTLQPLRKLPDLPMDPAEKEEVVRILAEVLDARRAKQAMDPAPPNVSHMTARSG